jgi:hypothetical protein
MARHAALGVAALSGLLLAACTGGNFGAAGLSLPASADGVQTVSDAADALDAHRSLASESAKTAIAATDAFGSFVREIAADQRMLAGVRHGAVPPSLLRATRLSTSGHAGKQIRSASTLVLGTPEGMSGYCQSAAGYTVNGIPSLDQTFGWEGGALTGGTRSGDVRGSATWLANATGAVESAPIGALSIARTDATTTCPMNVPAFTLKGGASENAFSIPLSMTFRRDELSSLNVTGGKFANGERLAVTSQPQHQSVAVQGAISNQGTQVATFHTDASGSGTLTITSTGAQYVISDWIVVGT